MYNNLKGRGWREKEVIPIGNSHRNFNLNLFISLINCVSEV